MNKATANDLTKKKTREISLGIALEVFIDPDTKLQSITDWSLMMSFLKTLTFTTANDLAPSLIEKKRYKLIKALNEQIDSLMSKEKVVSKKGEVKENMLKNEAKRM